MLNHPKLKPDTERKYGNMVRLESQALKVSQMILILKEPFFRLHLNEVTDKKW